MIRLAATFSGRGVIGQVLSGYFMPGNPPLRVEIRRKQGGGFPGTFSGIFFLGISSNNFAVFQISKSELENMGGFPG